MKPRWPEKPGGGASIWKRDPVGTFGRYSKSRYDTLKGCSFVIYERLPSRNNRRKSLLYYKKGVHCIPHKLTVYQVELNVYDPECLAHDLGQGATGTTGTTLNVEATDECPASFVTEDGIINEDSGVTATAVLSLLGMVAMRRPLQPRGQIPLLVYKCKQ